MRVISQKFSELQDKHDGHIRQLQELEAANTRLERDLNDAIAEASLASERVSSLEELVQERDQDLGDELSKLEGCQIQIEDLKKSLQETQIQRNELMEEQRQLLIKHQAAEERIKESSIESELRSQEISTLISARETAMSELNRHKAASKNDLAHLQDLNQVLEEEVGGLNVKVANARKEATIARKALLETREEETHKQDALAAELDQVKAKLNSVTLRAEVLDNDKSSLTAEKAALETQHKHSLEAYNALDEELKNLKAQLHASNETIKIVEAKNIAILRQIQDANMVSEVDKGRIDELEKEKRELKACHNELSNNFESFKHQLNEQILLNKDKDTDIEKKMAEIQELRGAKADLVKKVQETLTQYKTASDRASDLCTENNYQTQLLENAAKESKALKERFEQNRKNIIAQAEEEKALLVKQYEQEKEEATATAMKDRSLSQIAHTKELTHLRNMLDESKAELERQRNEFAQQVQASEALTKDLRNHHESTVLRQKQSLMESHAAALADMNAAAEEKEHQLTERCEALEKNKEALQQAIQKLKANNNVSISQLQKHIAELEEQLKMSHEALVSNEETTKRGAEAHEDHLRRTVTELTYSQEEVKRLQEAALNDRQEMEKLINEMKVTTIERDALKDEKSRYWEKLEDATRNLRVARTTLKEKEAELEKVRREVSQHEKKSNFCVISVNK